MSSNSSHHVRHIYKAPPTRPRFKRGPEKGFIEEATGLSVNTDDAFLMVQHAVKQINQKRDMDLSERYLDNLMWNYMAG